VSRDNAPPAFVYEKPTARWALEHPAMNIKIALLTILLLARSAMAQDQNQELPGFLGIPWGANPEDAKKELISRTHAHFNLARSAEQHLAFDGGKFASFKVRSLKLLFVANSFYSAEFFLETPSKKHEKEYATLKSMLIEKYGTPKRDEAVGEGFEANWFFPVPGGLPPHNLWIIQNPAGEGVKVVYLSEATRNAATQAAGAHEPAKPLKPAAAGATKAKDDL
jgi:hypothetical protein